ncbi:LIC10280 family protein [Pannonibacter sp.]|uniref:LIC10280 family protein n=1 Tax=Pannonibacter sp. TaxID=1906786 RepID=UPI003F6E95D4
MMTLFARPRSWITLALRLAIVVFACSPLFLAPSEAAAAPFGKLQADASRFAPVVRAFNPQPASLEGSYAVEGRNPDGSTYKGRLQLRVQDGRAFLRWEVGGSVYLGEGTLAGDILTVYWGQPDPVVYVVRPDRTLEGTWARGRASEKLLPLK